MACSYLRFWGTGGEAAPEAQEAKSDINAGEISVSV